MKRIGYLVNFILDGNRRCGMTIYRDTCAGGKGFAKREAQARLEDLKSAGHIKSYRLTHVCEGRIFETA